MNLKRLKDDLFINPLSGDIKYQRIGENQRLTEVRGLTFTVGNLFKKSQGIYSLMRLKASGSLSDSDVQKFLKHDLTPDLIGYDELVSDLNKSLKSFLTIVVARDLKNKGIEGGSIEVDLHMIKSSSNLTNLLSSAFESTQIGDYKFIFTTPQYSFEKNYDKAWFDKEAFIESLKGKEDFSEDKAREYADDVERRFRKGLDLGKGLSKIFGKTESYLRHYVRDLTKYFNHPEFNALVIFLIDDFTTSGTTLDQMELNVRRDLQPIEASLVYKIALFSK